MDLQKELKESMATRERERKYWSARAEKHKQKKREIAKRLQQYQDDFMKTTTYWKMSMGLIQKNCNEVLHYMMQRVHLSLADRRFIINWFNKIFGKKRIKLPPPHEPMPKLTVFTVSQDAKWKNFLSPGNLLDLDRTIKVYMRIRPQNEAEKAMKERHERSYSIDSTKEIVTFGQGKTARHYRYNLVLDETATQDDVGKI